MIDKMDEKMQNFNWNVQSMKKNQMDILKLKNILSEIKNSFNVFNSRQDTA